MHASDSERAMGMGMGYLLLMPRRRRRRLHRLLARQNGQQRRIPRRGPRGRLPHIPQEGCLGRGGGLKLVDYIRLALAAMASVIYNIALDRPCQLASHACCRMHRLEHTRDTATNNTTRLSNTPPKAKQVHSTRIPQAKAATAQLT